MVFINMIPSLAQRRLQHIIAQSAPQACTDFMLGSVDKGKLLGSHLSQIYILATGFIEKKKKSKVTICKCTRTSRS